jgi:lysophospholipase L1-like esterase
MAQPAPRRQRNYLLLSVLATTLVIFLLVLLAEGGVRLRQWLRHGQTGTVNSMLVPDPASGLEVPRPGVHSGKIHINSQGFRSPELTADKPRLRLAFLGASTTFCAEVSRDEAAWPNLVAEHVKQAHPALSLDFVNAGVPGYVVDTSMENWRHRVAKLKPDVVVIYHATNDLSKDTRALAVQQGLQSAKRQETSWLADHSMLWFLVEKTWAVKAAQQRAVSDSPRLTEIPPQLPQGFQERLVRLVREVQAQGALVALPTFTHRPRRGQSPEEQLKAAESALYYMPYMSLPGLLSGYEAYNQAIRLAAQETGALLIEGEYDIPGDAGHFTDSVHFSDTGSMAMAQRVSQALLGSPQFQSLLAGKSGP